MFRMSFSNHTTDWFEWLYVDFDTLNEIANEADLSCNLLIQDENHYLVELKTA